MSNSMYIKWEMNENHKLNVASYKKIWSTTRQWDMTTHRKTNGTFQKLESTRSVICRNIECLYAHTSLANEFPTKWQCPTMWRVWLVSVIDSLACSAQLWSTLVIRQYQWAHIQSYQQQSWIKMHNGRINEWRQFIIRIFDRIKKDRNKMRDKYIIKW